MGVGVDVGVGVGVGVFVRSDATEYTHPHLRSHTQDFRPNPHAAYGEDAIKHCQKVPVSYGLCLMYVYEGVV